MLLVSESFATTHWNKQLSCYSEKDMTKIVSLNTSIRPKHFAKQVGCFLIMISTVKHDVMFK